MEENSQSTAPVTAEDTKKKHIEEICKKVMAVVLPCIAVLILILSIFEGSSEARGVRSALKDENCNARLYTGEEVSETLDELELELQNVDELVVAQDEDDEDVFAFVFFCESRSDAEEVEDYCSLLLLLDDALDRYTVDRNASVVCFGHEDLVEAAMEELD